MQDLALDNIEALAANEGSDYIICMGWGSVDCPINHEKVEYVVRDYGLEVFN